MSALALFAPFETERSNFQLGQQRNRALGFRAYHR
jgi:hypothetical protein